MKCNSVFEGFGRSVFLSWLLRMFNTKERISNSEFRISAERLCVGAGNERILSTILLWIASPGGGGAIAVHYLPHPFFCTVYIKSLSKYWENYFKGSLRSSAASFLSSENGKFGIPVTITCHRLHQIVLYEMSTWTHSPTCYPLGSLFDSVSGVNCSALCIWIRDLMMFNLAHIFPFLFQNNKAVLEGFWTTLGDHFQFSCKTYGKTHPHLQLIPWDCLTHSRHSKMEKAFQAVSI